VEHEVVVKIVKDTAVLVMEDMVDINVEDKVDDIVHKSYINQLKLKQEASVYHERT